MLDIVESIAHHRSSWQAPGAGALAVNRSYILKIFVRECLLLVSVALSVTSSVVGIYNLLMIPSLVILDITNIIANAVIVSASLIPSMITTGLTRLLIGRRLQSTGARSIFILAGSIGTGALFIWFDYVDVYFTPIGFSLIFCFIGILLGAMVGLGYWFAAAQREQTAA